MIDLKDIKFLCDTSTDYDYTNSSMTENRLFLYWLTTQLQPSLILELGTYYGCSFFAFTQAIKDHKIPTTLMGVDTWEGDEHTLFYGEEVMKVFQLVQLLYSEPNCFAYKDTFENFLANLKNDIADIILIDGLHTYEASKQDFEQSLPKLKENGIILFHDIKVDRFSLQKYWNELKNQYAWIEVNNIYGLGILFPKGIANRDRVIEILDVLEIKYER